MPIAPRPYTMSSMTMQGCWPGLNTAPRLGTVSKLEIQSNHTAAHQRTIEGWRSKLKIATSFSTSGNSTSLALAWNLFTATGVP
jgi:hypothetical protein